MKDEIRVTWVDLLRRLAPLLPADLFARLRVFSSLAVLSADENRTLADYLHEAISALDTLHHTLTTFLPRYLLDLAPKPGQPHGELLEGSFIFADVTGFTALTGELSRRGTTGREEMNKLMRALFAALLEPLLNSGGDLLIFAGDAVLASFPARPEGQDARWATRTALRLVEAIVPFAHLETPYGTFSLTMSAGVERGAAFAAAVGSQRRMEFLISGGPVQGAMQAEGMAEPKQVFAGLGVLPFLRPDEFILRGNVVEGIHGGELSDYEPPPPARRRRRISAIFSRRVPDLLEHLDVALKQVEALIPFIPPDLFAQIASGEDIRQHPPVAIQFVNVLGLEEIALGPAGPEQAAAILQRYFVQAQDAIAKREGIISQVDAYAKGFTLLNPFGAPTHHEGVPRLAASAALELDRVLGEVNQEFGLDPPLTQRTGLTYARIFTGEIGYLHRREYVVAGPAVNLAARLMSKAEPGQIVLDPIAWEAVQGDFVAGELPPIPLKGIAEPVPRFLLQGVRKGKGLRIADYPIVGCQRERAVLETLLDEAVAGRGGAVVLVGESGYGKNLLASHVVSQAISRGMTVLTSRCQPFAQSTPYLPWKGMLDEWLELDGEMPYESRREKLRERLARFDMAHSLPAFADLLDLSGPSSSLQIREGSDQGRDMFAALQEHLGQTERGGEDGGRDWRASLSSRAAKVEKLPRPEGKGPSIWDVVRERASISYAICLLLDRLARQGPTLVAIEDIHWMDPDSWQILDSAARAACAGPLFVLVTSRPGSDCEGDRIMLHPLSGEDSQTLAALALRAVKLEPDLAAWLLDRARGNPLFITSYCRALRDAGAVVVDPASGEARWSGPPPPLPLSLQELLLAQVERLGKETREVLRRGAVIGTTFPVWLLAHLSEDVLPVGRLTHALGEAARNALIAPPPFAQAHTFSNQSLHDAIYATLSHAARQRWHERAGDRLAQTDAPTLYERLEQIAYHYGRGGDAYKAAHFTRRAGDKARVRQADDVALAFYAQTLSVEAGADVAAEQRSAHEGIGDVRALRGEGEAAAGAYRAALAGASERDARRLEAKLALVSPLIGPADLGPLQDAQQQLDRSASLQPWLEAALCWVHAERGEMETAVAACERLSSKSDGLAGSLLREMLAGLDRGEPSLSYTDFFALLAPSYLRAALPGGEL
ncbi:MAG: AAA family ATPase [Anaerolineae bacterium]|nr:AAA family ATPase [Anaerolineae bacterium]